FSKVIHDETERRRATEVTLQRQKLQSVGLLAGGIAHDFNNLLTGVIGNASLLLEQVPPGAVGRVRQILSSAERAAHLTKQLLAYSGKGKFVVEEVDVSEAVNAVSGLVQFSIPKGVQLELAVQTRLPCVEVDPNQLQQILMNLVINAGEAIGEGHPGKITVATGMSDVDEPFVDATGQEVQPGRYVWIEVRDTGTGIAEEDKTRIFEPFFTTKFTGRGMGLAAVAGIVRAQKGAITVESKLGRGSTFRVYLPATSKHVAPEQPVAAARATVLVVDDEFTVRDVATAVLSGRGYRVLTATDGREALALLARKEESIDAVVLDIVMPVMGAHEFLPVLRAHHPHVKVLLTSGYSESEARRLAGAGPESAFLPKPFTADQIATAVDELLGVRPKGA
ncbi:MAG: ATP-binding protein, partial [bacterium]